MIRLNIPPIEIRLERDPANGIVHVAIHDAAPEGALLLAAQIPVSDCVLVHGEPLSEFFFGPFGVSLADDATAALVWNELGGAIQ